MYVSEALSYTRFKIYVRMQLLPARKGGAAGEEGVDEWWIAVFFSCTLSFFTLCVLARVFTCLPTRVRRAGDV